MSCLCWVHAPDLDVCLQKAPDSDIVLVHDDDLITIDELGYDVVSEYLTGSEIVFLISTVTRNS